MMRTSAQLLSGLGPAQLVADLNGVANPAPASNPSHLKAAGSTLFFVADDGLHGPELWKSDGTPGGATRVRGVRPGPEGANPHNLFAMGSTLYFAANHVGLCKL